MYFSVFRCIFTYFLVYLCVFYTYSSVFSELFYAKIRKTQKNPSETTKKKSKKYTKIVHYSGCPEANYKKGSPYLTSKVEERDLFIVGAKTRLRNLFERCMTTRTGFIEMTTKLEVMADQLLFFIDKIVLPCLQYRYLIQVLLLLLINCIRFSAFNIQIVLVHKSH